VPYRPAPRITELGDGFYDAVEPARFPVHKLRFRNQRAAERVGLGDLDPETWESRFARFTQLPENLAAPLAMRYHGHQFMVYNPQLGDGRGFVYAQLLDENERLLDLGTKGSGRTPWSRGGDGKLTLKGGFREVLCTEMLEALGVHTSRSFSLFETGESLVRGDEPSPTRSSVLVRLSHSHVRFGTFQRFAYANDVARLRKLFDYCVAQLVPLPEGEASVAGFLREVSRRTGALAASYSVAGFVHGVLNTDNMSITGESFDYGPYRFLPTFDPGFIAAYFDHSGLYCFGNQPRAMVWNLQRLAECLSQIEPSLDHSPSLEEFRRAYESEMVRRLLARLGLAPAGIEADEALVDAVYDFLLKSQIPFDQFFFDWFGGDASSARAAKSPAAHFYQGDAFAAVRFAISAHSPTAPERLALPYFQRSRPCSLIIDELEAIWTAIATDDNWAPFEQKIAAMREMGEAIRA
jgi:uncharacterized protein YdiU (UPF0061 family)